MRTTNAHKKIIKTFRITEEDNNLLNEYLKQNNITLSEMIRNQFKTIINNNEELNGGNNNEK